MSYSNHLDGQLDRLTARQRQVLDLVVRGRSNQQIADELGISIDGAKWHLREIFARLGIDSREDAADAWRAYRSRGATMRRSGKTMLSWISLKAAFAAAGGIAAATVAVVAVAFLPVRSAEGGQEGDVPTPAITASVLVSGNAMHPTLRDGTRVPFDPLAYVHADPQPGDVIVLALPESVTRFGQPVVMVRRVVAVERQTIEVVDGQLWVDGQRQDEPYIAERWHDTRAPLTVPAGHVFVMGDNRDNSADSRSIQIGPIPDRLILGRIGTSASAGEVVLPTPSPPDR